MDANSKTGVLSQEIRAVPGPARRNPHWEMVSRHDPPKKSAVGRLSSLLVVICALAVPASASWNEKVLYSFQGIPDGSLPVGGIVFDSAGNLYGATTEGGSSSCVSVAQCGTVYQLVPSAKQGGAWTETVLYVFKGNASQDGASPAGGLVMDSAGNLYGTTAYGGTGNCVLLGTLMGCGTVFELSPPIQNGGKWTETVLYSFPTAKQGYSAEWGSGLRQRRQSLRSNAVWRWSRNDLQWLLPILRRGIRAEPAEDQGRQLDGKSAARLQGERQERSLVTEPIPTAGWFSTARVRSTARPISVAIT